MTNSRLAFLALILASSACGGKRVDPMGLPTEPVAAVRQFMEGVRANDLAVMGGVWGSSKGPATAWMNSEELQKRLMVVRSYLSHETYGIEPGGALPGNSSGERMVRVRLNRRGCAPVVPFTTLQYRGRWLVSAIDLEAAGNPARPCQ
ncbi:MAG: hypothetical protein OEY20_11610 [Gemmatimonadota bacterium]|nr:hypothetical protein [Gemmatimonadota bacterium]MDH5197887.1 hypothetical protein [Gemmatimonadota bacterium]